MRDRVANRRETTLTAQTQLNPWVRRANILGCLVLVVAIGYLVVKMAYLFFDPSAGHRAPEFYGNQDSSRGRASSMQRNDKVDTAAIARWSLFGKEGQKAVAKQVVKEDVNAPKTRLNLELQGVFVAPVEENSTAMIAESRRDSKLYHIGDKVPGNVSLAAVHPDRVLLNRSGKLEALYFTENKAGGLSRSAADRRSSFRDRRSTSSRSARRPPTLGRAPGMRPGARSAMANQMVSSLKEQIDQNPQAVLSQFGLTDNNGRGYKVSANANPMLSAVGAKAGDLIIAINGRALGDISQDINLIEEVMNEGSVRATLERDGTQFDSEVAIPGG